jgi:uncharacterized protein
VFGSRAAYACEFLVDPKLDPTTAADVLALMLDAAEQHAATVGAASTAALYVNARGREQLSRVVDEGAGFFIAGANSVIEVTWGSFEDYVASRGHQARKIRRQVATFRGCGYELATGPLSAWIQPAAELFAQLERKYGHDDSAETEARELRTLAASADRFSHMLMLRRGGTVIGAVLLLLAEDTVYARTAGFDYDRIGDGFEYFNLAYYEPIRYAIEHGYRRIDYGMATYRAKLVRGGRVEPLWGILASATAGDPLLDSAFSAWSRRRATAIDSQDPTLLEEADLP